MGTLRHSVGIAVCCVAVSTSRNDTVSLEPSPRSGDLTTVAVEGEAVVLTAAASSISGREETLESLSTA